MPLFPSLQLSQNMIQNLSGSLNTEDLTRLISSFRKQSFQNELLTLFEMRKQMLQQLFPMNFEPRVKIEAGTSLVEKNALIPLSERAVQIPKNNIELDEKLPESSKRNDIESVKVQVPRPESMKEELEEMINFILNSIGKFNQNSAMEKGRMTYSKKPYLLPIFDALIQKLSPVKKHREDVIRYIIRRALKFMKKSIIEKEKVYGKRAYAALCKKYFEFDSEKLEKLGINTQDEKELIDFLLPYRKNSKNRTMNTDFTSEIFSSPEFCNDYKEFLKIFGKDLESDNLEKIKKLVQLSEECIKKNNTSSIKKCSRLPWLQTWIEKTKETAQNLVTDSLEESKGKQIKSASSPLAAEIIIKKEF